MGDRSVAFASPERSLDFPTRALTTYREYQNSGNLGCGPNVQFEAERELQPIATVLRADMYQSGQFGTNICREHITKDDAHATNQMSRLSTLGNSIKGGLKRTFSRSKKSETISFHLNSVSQIDRMSRVLFPIAFIVINIMYWHMYLSAES